MAKKGGLGLGLGLEALIGGKSDATQEDIEIATKGKSSDLSANLPDGITMDDDGNLWVNPNLLVPNPRQPRKDFKQKELEELSASIKEHGVIEPVLIEKTDTENFYIIAGERRTRAAKMAGVEKIPVHLVKFDDLKKLEVALIENIQRQDLNPIEEAQAYYDLMKMGELTQEDVARRVGKKRPTIANAVRLLKLPEDMQKSLVDGQITAGHARALLTCANVADMRVLFGKIVSQNMSAHDAEQLAQQYNNGGRVTGKKVQTSKKEDKNPDVAEIEQKFIEVFGTKVVLKGTIEKGTIQIDYFSKEDLNRLYNVIVK